MTERHGDAAGDGSRHKARPVEKPLAFVVRGEAHRLLADDQLEPDPALVAQGWERRFVADGKRAREAIALYEELGYEVHAEPVHPEHVNPDCEDCLLVAMMHFQMIYTRKPKGTT